MNACTAGIGTVCQTNFHVHPVEEAKIEAKETRIFTG